MLFEKAYAKLHNGYDAIDGGRPEQAFVDLTNGIADYIDFTSDDFKEMYDDGSFWNWIVNAINSGCICACSSQGTSDTNKSDLGIVEGHAYSLLDAEVVEGHKIV